MIGRLTLALMATLLALPAHAQALCGERDSFLRQLAENYDEAPVALGLVSTGSVLEVVASKAGTWTILVTNPAGTTCVMAAGEAWEDLPKRVAGPGA